MTDDRKPGAKTPERRLIGRTPGRVALLGAVATLAATHLPTRHANAISERVKARQRDIQNREQIRSEILPCLQAMDVAAMAKVFTRHRMALPPGWETPGDETFLKVMHTARLLFPEIGPTEKAGSATWLVGRKHPLPDGMQLRDGILWGAKYSKLEKQDGDKTTDNGTSGEG